MRILVTGGNGQLAKTIHLLDKKNIIVLARQKELNVTNKESISAAMKKYSPDMIYHFASVTRGDQCAQHPDLAYKVNVVGTKNIAKATKDVDIPVVFVSTNEVFDGKKTKPYTESDKPNPQSVVGKNKWDAEKIIARINPKHYIVRTIWLYSEWSENFIHAIVKKARSEKSIKLVNNEVGCPTYSLDLAIAIQKLTSTRVYGTYHLSNKGSVSRLDFGVEVFRLLNLHPHIIPISLKEYDRMSLPPEYSVLANIRAKELGITMRNWKLALKDFFGKNAL